KLISSALCTVGADRRREQISEYGWGRLDWDEVVSEDGEGVCAIGAYLWHRKVRAGMDPAEAFDSLPLIFGGEDGSYDTANAAKAAGVAYCLAWDLAYRNDQTFAGKPPEERWQAFMDWIDSELGAAA